MLRRRLKLIALAIGLPMAGVLLIVAYFALRPAGTAPIPGERSIAELERVDIGGAKQWILVRGADREAPILLYLHAGPGVAAMPFASIFSPGLEKRFTVVQWDRRGAGKTCAANVPAGDPYLETSVSDAAALVRLLRERLGERPVYVVGHGSGATIGALLAHAHPELVSALVMVAPLVDTVGNEKKVLEWLRGQARSEGDANFEQKLAALSVPYANPTDFGRVHQEVAARGGEITGEQGMWPLLVHGLLAREYSLGDKLSYFDCIDASLKAAWDPLWKVDLAKSAPSIAVPVYAILGEKDRTISREVVEGYMAALEAPEKRTVVIEKAADYPMFEQPARFDAELISLLAGKAED